MFLLHGFDVRPTDQQHDLCRILASLALQCPEHCHERATLLDGLPDVSVALRVSTLPSPLFGTKGGG
jgi:hypothetical protein